MTKICDYTVRVTVGYACVFVEDVSSRFMTGSEYLLG